MIKVNVTALDIRDGVRSDIGACPIARAVKRSKRSRGDVWAGPVHISTGLLVYKTPPNVRQWMENYDDGREVEPFTFELTELEETNNVS